MIPKGETDRDIYGNLPKIRISNGVLWPLNKRSLQFTFNLIQKLIFILIKKFRRQK